MRVSSPCFATLDAQISNSRISILSCSYPAWLDVQVAGGLSPAICSLQTEACALLQGVEAPAQGAGALQARVEDSHYMSFQIMMYLICFLLYIYIHMLHYAIDIATKDLFSRNSSGVFKCAAIGQDSPAVASTVASTSGQLDPQNWIACSTKSGVTACCHGT